MIGLRQDQRRVEGHNLDVCPPGGRQFFGPASEIVIRGDAQLPCISSSLFQPDPQTMPREDSNARIIRRINHIHAHPERLGKETKISAQVGGIEANFGTDC